MHSRTFRFLWALLLALGGACSDSGPQAFPDASAIVDAGGGPFDDAGVGDAGAQSDAGLDGGSVGDAGPADGGTEGDGGALDAGSPDAGVSVPLGGFGAISGECGELDDAEWNTPGSFYFRGAIDLGTAAFDETALSTGGQKVFADGNLGGSSIHSEVFAYEVLYRCELAELIKTEGEIGYLDAGLKKTDLLVRIDGRKVGVSVTRAYHFPPSNPYTVAEATTLLSDKLADIAVSMANAAPGDAWERSILSVIAYDAQYADVLKTAYDSLSPSVTSNTILYVTVTDGNDGYIY